MKNILITGVSKGIGRKLAQHFHGLGFHVYGAYRWSEGYKNNEQLAETLKQELPNLTMLPCDLADRDAIAQTIHSFEGMKLDGIINNAGTFLDNSWGSFDIASWDKSIAVNMTAPLLLVLGLQDNLHDGSSVVNISSTDANYAAFKDLGYAASKAGLINVTKSMASALGRRNIRVNAIAPGWVDTDMATQADVSEYASYQTPLGRNATTQEIVNVVEFLISDKSSFITGTVINADGGYSSVDYAVKKEFDA